MVANQHRLALAAAKPSVKIRARGFSVVLMAHYLRFIFLK